MKAVFPALDGFGLSGARANRRDAKRLLDIVVAALALIFLAPVLVAVAIAVALESPGPVLFAQARTGLGGRTFAILKFRSMRVREEGAAVVQAVENDVRVTRVGRIIRKLSLDELPQLFNVLTGDMSLVGPRPHAIVHDEYYGARIAAYRERFQVKPGITGWAQIHGARGATPALADMQRRIDLDVWYARNGDFLLDLKILARTPLEVLSTRNAH